MLVIAGYAFIKEDKLGEAIPIITKMSIASEAESGCISYKFSRDIHDSTKFFLFEEWESLAALEEHFQTAHMAEFRIHLPNLLASEMVIKRYDVSNIVDM